MKKIFSLVFVLMLLVSSVSFGQAFKQGDKIVNLGIGLVGLGLNATGEYGISENIGVGAFVGYERYSYGYAFSSINGNYSRSEFSLGVRGAFHAGELIKLDSKFDPYLAAGVGANIYTDPYWDYNFNNNTYISKSFVSPILLFRLGGRYYFKENMAAFGEIGTGGSWITGGISFKL